MIDISLMEDPDQNSVVTSRFAVDVLLKTHVDIGHL